MNKELYDYLISKIHNNGMPERGSFKTDDLPGSGYDRSNWWAIEEIILSLVNYLPKVR